VLLPESYKLHGELDCRDEVITFKIPGHSKNITRREAQTR